MLEETVRVVAVDCPGESIVTSVRQYSRYTQSLS
jgi:hypothetical protein